jgi:hypothetical protein
LTRGQPQRDDIAVCSELYAATTAAALVPIDVTDDEFGLEAAARIAACSSSTAVRICCTWGPNCDCAAVWNSVRLVWILSTVVWTSARLLLTLSEPSAPTDARSLFAASQYAGVPLLPPLEPPLPGLVAAVLAPGAGVGVDVPLLEQPATSATANASATSSGRAAVQPATGRDRLVRASVPAR